MALGILSEKDFERELSRSEVVSLPELPVKTEVLDIEKGRGKGNNEVPNSLRKIIGEEAIINGRQSAIALAEQFGISTGSVDAYSSGSTSSASNKQPNLDFLNKARLRNAERAMQVLDKAFSVTEEKIDECDAMQASSIAKSMSGIVKDMEPVAPKNGEGNGAAGPTYVFYSPQIKQENHYETVNVRE